MTAGLPLKKSVLKPLAKNVLLPLGLSAGMSAADTATTASGSRTTTLIGSGTTALIISNEKIEDIMKIVKSLEESRLLVKEINETIKKETKQQKGGFLSMLLGTIAAGLLESALTGKGVMRAGEGLIRTDKTF